jgi:hypothetical protein
MVLTVPTKRGPLAASPEMINVPATRVSMPLPCTEVGAGTSSLTAHGWPGWQPCRWVFQGIFLALCWGGSARNRATYWRGAPRRRQLGCAFVLAECGPDPPAVCCDVSSAAVSAWAITGHSQRLPVGADAGAQAVVALSWTSGLPLANDASPSAFRTPPP